ncbi:type II toxin-antitoxin system RelE/ParE family toxin [Thiomicrorhabdus cannonii]|uniref:type II toxin-antitoxin system RelE/ParE family toxin n=1 Tax=Thiomicrorhabdus cannonii TaxID=2748011 RepID=UPI0015BA606E|nr:type II toxin-antitoxin system RelE/ParE family toxin [Thiomicrorhabdus cannonii]
MVKILQKPAFKRIYKKLHNNQLKDVNQAIQRIVQTPQIGTEKKGDLAGVYVYKFDCINQQFLLAYEWDETSRTLLLLGVHENFYRDLKT